MRAWSRANGLSWHFNSNTYLWLPSWFEQSTNFSGETQRYPLVSHSIWKSTCTIAQYNISRTFSQLFVGVIAWFVSITLGTKRCWRDYLYFSKTILANNLTLLTIKMPKYHDWHLSMSRNRKTIASLPATPLADLSLTTGIYRNRRNRRKSTSVY